MFWVWWSAFSCREPAKREVDFSSQLQKIDRRPVFPSSCPSFFERTAGLVSTSSQCTQKLHATKQCCLKGRSRTGVYIGLGNSAKRYLRLGHVCMCDAWCGYLALPGDQPWLCGVSDTPVQLSPDPSGTQSTCAPSLSQSSGGSGNYPAAACLNPGTPAACTVHWLKSGAEAQWGRLSRFPKRIFANVLPP